MKNSDEIVMLNGPPCILNELNLKIKGHTSRRTFDGYSKKDFKLEHATYLTYSIPLLGRRDSEKSSFKGKSRETYGVPERLRNLLFKAFK